MFTRHGPTQTAGPYGHRFTLDERMADMLGRHGVSSANALAHPQRAPYLYAAGRRIEARLFRASRAA
jgi:hypothetical protein